MRFSKRLLTNLAVMATVGTLLVGCQGQQVADTSAGEIEEPLSAGEQIFKAKCEKCHVINGVGGKKGPDLTGIGTRRDAEWLNNWLQDPKSVRANARMPRLPLSEDERADVVDFLSDQKI